VLVVDLTLARLQIGRPQSGVRIRGVGQQGLQILVCLGAFVQTADDADTRGDDCLVRIPEPRHRRARRIHAGAEQIARIARAEQRQIKIGSRTNAVTPQRIAKTVGVVRHMQFDGDIDRAEDPERRIRRQPKYRLESRHGSYLQEVIENDHRLFQVGGDVVNSAPDDALRGPVNQEGQGTNDMAIEPGVDGVVAPIEALPRIAIGHGRRRTSGIGPDNQHDHHDRNYLTAHTGLQNATVLSPPPGHDSIETCSRAFIR